MSEKSDRELRALQEQAERLVNPGVESEGASVDELLRWMAAEERGEAVGPMPTPAPELAAFLEDLAIGEDASAGETCSVAEQVFQAPGVLSAADRRATGRQGAAAAPVGPAAESEPNRCNAAPIPAPAPLPPGVRPLTAEERSVVSNRLGAWDEAEYWRQRLAAQRQTRRQT
jgi:hypothetical protein